MRLAIFGGSFNPPHRGHLWAAKAFCNLVCPHELLIIPTGTPPHKTPQFSCTDQQRLTMTQLNFSSLLTPFTVSDREMRRQGKSYTVDTLREIQKERPDAELFLYCGSDMLVSFSSWRCFEEILSLCTLCVMKRQTQVPEWEQAIRQLRPYCRFPLQVIPASPWEESSTHLREELRRGQIPEGLVKEVADYIQQEGLYR